MTKIKIAELNRENRELQALFKLQHSRVKKAEAYWRKKTKKNMIPDLGALIDFLMEEIRELEKENASLKRKFSGLGNFLQKRVTDLENKHLVYGNALSKTVGHEI